jgi:hypothetical protein
MSDPSPTFSESRILSDPFHGNVWFGISRQTSAPVVRLVVSLSGSWDVDVQLNAGDAATLADALGGHDMRIVTGKTADGDAVVVVADGDLLAITVPRERLSDILTLGDQARTIRECLRAAAGGGG